MSSLDAICEKLILLCVSNIEQKTEEKEESVTQQQLQIEDKK